jgi:hypothetical protein
LYPRDGAGVSSNIFITSSNFMPPMVGMIASGFFFGFRFFGTDSLSALRHLRGF